MRVKLKFLISDRDRHGNVRYYVRRNGHKTRIRGQEGSNEFLAEYEAAFEALASPGPVRAVKLRSKDSFEWLVDQYLNCPEFKRLAKNTIRTKTNVLVKLRDEHGGKAFKGLRKRHVQKMRDAKADFPAAANQIVKELGVMFNWAIEAGITKKNPAHKVKRFRIKTDGYHSWTLEEIKQYEDHHKMGTKARLALALLMYTGVRRSDVVKLGKQHCRGGRIIFNQEKTGGGVTVPVLKALQSAIDRSPTGDLTFLVTDFNKPFSVAGFGNRMRKWCDQAGLPHCSAHGVRKAAAASAAENGATVNELMAIFGWVSSNEAERYTRAASRKKLADTGIEKLNFEQDENKSVPL